MLNRRRFLAAPALFAAATLIRPLEAAASPDQAVAAARRDIARTLAAKGNVTADGILSSLGVKNLTPTQARIAIYELVKSVPYKLTAWKGESMSLFALGRGDCRHKAAAATQLLKRAGFKAEQRIVTFDWADLPIERRMLDLLTDTRSFHDTVYVQADGKSLLFDATWDPALGAVGFPVLDRWDGNSSTLPITRGKTQLVDPRAIRKGSNMYEHFGFRWPERKRTLEFNRAFNAWSDDVRAGGATQASAGGQEL